MFRCQIGGKIMNAMPSGILADKDAGATGAANGRCDKSIFKDDAVVGHGINIGCLDDVIAHAAECVPALVIGEEKNDVGAFW